MMDWYYWFICYSHKCV